MEEKLKRLESANVQQLKEELKAKGTEVEGLQAELRSVRDELGALTKASEAKESAWDVERARHTHEGETMQAQLSTLVAALGKATSAAEHGGYFFSAGRVRDKSPLRSCWEPRSPSGSTSPFSGMSPTCSSADSSPTPNPIATLRMQLESELTNGRSAGSTGEAALATSLSPPMGRRPGGKSSQRKAAAAKVTPKATPKVTPKGTPKGVRGSSGAKEAHSDHSDRSTT